MSRKTSAFFAFTWPVIFFLTVLGFAVLFAGPACGGDDLAALTKALEAQNAAKPAGCTCPECNCWTGEDCGADCAFGGKKPKEVACPGCLAARKAAGESRCGCGNPGVCSARGCGGTQPCDDESCPRAARAEGSTRTATDGGADWTWTNAEGGYYWRYAAPPAYSRPTYYAPPRQAFFAPSFGGGCVGGS